MPKGAQSLIPYTPSVFTAQSAVVYKGNIDANASIVSNVAGMLYCYPTTPASLSVLVDIAFNMPLIGIAGGTAFFQPTTPPTSVLLVPPATGVRFACIGWNLTNNSVAVTYGPIAPSVAQPTYPDRVEIDPVAYVLLRAGQTTVQATDINDVRSSISPSSLLISTAASSVPSDLTLSDCSGANLVFHFISFAVGSANSQTFRLTNARIGLDLGFYIQNISGAPKFFGYQATTPAGTLQHIVAYNSQALSGVDMTSTGFTIQNNIAMIARTCLSNGQIIVLYQLP